jgi:hypothetical protein
VTVVSLSLGTSWRTCCWALRPMAISSFTETNCSPPVALVADTAKASVKMIVLNMIVSQIKLRTTLNVPD